MDEEKIICLKCPHSRFPEPNEQCYRFGGLICGKYDTNVGKYDDCSVVKARLERGKRDAGGER